MENQQLNSVQKLRIAWKWILAGIRWLSIVFFGVLFFIGLYFQLPWKVLACLAVIPVVGLFVPKKIQSWIWLSLTVLLMSLFGWLHLPENNTSRWQPYQFHHDLTLLENQSPLTGPNAADLYNKVLQEHGETIFYFRFASELEEQQTLTQPWDPNEHPRLDFWITTFEPAINTLTQAAALNQCRFDIPHNIPSMDPQMGRLNQLKGWTRLLLRASGRDLYTGQTERALQKQLAAIGIARHLYQQKTLFDQAAAFHIELLGTRALESYIIEHGKSDDLLRIAAVFSGLDPRWPANWPHILAREQLQTKNLFGLLYETNETGRIRFSHAAMTALQEGLGYKPLRLFINQQTMNRLAVIGMWLCLPSNPEKMGELIDQRFNHYSLQAQQDSQFYPISLRYIWVLGLNIQSIVDWLAMQPVGYYWAFNGQFTRHEAILNRIRIFSELKQYVLAHNQWPERLEDLNLEDPYVVQDPLNQKPFQYRRTDTGFLFYSLGPNGMDDGGQYDMQAGKDDIQIWPPKSRLEDELVDNAS